MITILHTSKGILILRSSTHQEGLFFLLDTDDSQDEMSVA
jgi:hypothetical protein